MGCCNGGILIFVQPLVGIYELSGETMALAIMLAADPRRRVACALASLLRAAQRSARGQRREVHHGGLRRQHGCLAVGFSYIIGVRMGMGAVGVWIAMVMDWVCRVICFVTRIRSGAWKTKYQADNRKGRT